MKTYPLDINALYDLYIPIMYNAKRITTTHQNGETIELYKDSTTGIIEVTQVKGTIKSIYFKDTKELFEVKS